METARRRLKVMGDIILRVANLNASGRLSGIAAGARSFPADHVLADAARLDPDKVFGVPLAAPVLALPHGVHSVLVVGVAALPVHVVLDVAGGQAGGACGVWI